MATSEFDKMSTLLNSLLPNAAKQKLCLDAPTRRRCVFACQAQKDVMLVFLYL
jgi:hypothetical protein